MADVIEGHLFVYFSVIIFFLYFLQKVHYLGAIWKKFRFVLCKFSIGTVTAPAKGAILDDFFGQHHHQSTRFNPQFFGANKMQVYCTFWLTE